MRCVGDELALTLEHRLGLAASGIERAEHAVQRPRQLVDLIVGLHRREMQAGIASALDLACRVGEFGDRPHRPLSRPQACEQGQDGAAEDAQDQEDAHAGDRLVEVRDRACVEELQLSDRLGAQLPDRDPIAVLGQQPVRLDRCGAQRRRGDRRIRSPDLQLRAQKLAGVRVEDPDLRLLRGRVVVESNGAVGAVHELPALELELAVQLGLQLVGREPDLVVELLDHLALGEQAEDRGERGEDDERQHRGAAGQTPADRQPPIRGERSPRRGSCVRAEALHPLQASSGGSRRTPRSCLSLRMGHSPRPRRVGAAARSRSAHCA